MFFSRFSLWGILVEVTRFVFYAAVILACAKYLKSR